MAPQGKPFKPPRTVNTAASLAKKGTFITSPTTDPEQSTVQRSVDTLQSDAEDDPFAMPQSLQPEIASEESFTATDVNKTVEGQAVSGKETIPQDLLTRLLYEFMPDGLKMSKGADAAVGRYMDLFVREAVCRAQVEASEGRRGDGFLEVEDLEKLAPQLVLDF